MSYKCVQLGCEKSTSKSGHYCTDHQVWMNRYEDSRKWKEKTMNVCVYPNCWKSRLSDDTNFCNDHEHLDRSNMANPEATTKIVKIQEHEFKPGDKVFDLRYVVVKLEKLERNPSYDLVAECSLDNWQYYTYEGKQDNHIYPILVTLARARQMGFEIPEEPIEFSCKVRWEKSKTKSRTVLFLDPLTPDKEWPVGGLRGKIGTITFKEEMNYD